MDLTMLPPGAGIWYLRAGTLEALAKHSLMFGTFGPPPSEAKAYLLGDETLKMMVLVRRAILCASWAEGDDANTWSERQKTMLVGAEPRTSASMVLAFARIQHPILGAWNNDVFSVSVFSLARDDARELARRARERQLAWLYLHEQLVLTGAQFWGYFETSIDQERCRYCDVAKQEGRHQ